MVGKDAPYVEGPDRPDSALPRPLMTEPTYTGILITLQRHRETGSADRLGDL